MPDTIPPPDELVYVSASTLKEKYLPIFYYKCVHITTMDYTHISGFILEEKNGEFHLSSGIAIKVESVRYINCRESFCMFVVDHEEDFIPDPAWKKLPIEILMLCMTFARDITDLVLWRGVSKSIYEALPNVVDRIECLDMRHLGGRCWDLKGKRDPLPISTVLRYYYHNQIEHLSLPREFYIIAEELKEILSFPQEIKMITMWFPSIFLRRLFKGGAVWSESVETIRLIGMGINRATISPAVLKSMKDHLPNLKVLIIDYSNFFSSNPADLKKIALSFGIIIEFGPFFDALENVNSVAKMEYAIDTLKIDPSFHFLETFHLRQTRATNLMDLAVVKSVYPAREEIIRYLASRGATIRDCVNRYAWWSVIASQDCERDLQVFADIARKQAHRLMSPVMLESISKLKDIRDIDQKEVATLFFDKLPADIFSEPENVFRIVCFDSPQYHNFMMNIIRQYASSQLLECCNSERETVFSLAIRNKHLSDLNLLHFITPNLPYKNGLFGTDKSSYLHLAVANDRPRLVDALLTGHEVKVNVFDNNGETPLHVAARLQHFHIVNLLLMRGACPTTKRKSDNKNAWEIAHSVAKGHAMFIPPYLKPNSIMILPKKRSLEDGREDGKASKRQRTNSGDGRENGLDGVRNKYNEDGEQSIFNFTNATFIQQNDKQIELQFASSQGVLSHFNYSNE